MESQSTNIVSFKALSTCRTFHCFKSMSVMLDKGLAFFVFIKCLVNSFLEITWSYNLPAPYVLFIPSYEGQCYLRC